MPRFDVRMLRYLEPEQLRVLQAIEMGMKNHELVPKQLIAAIAGLRHGGTYKLLAELIKHHLVGYEKGNREGYRLTTLGYDFLALKTLSNRAVLASVGQRIGTGKESDIYIVADAEDRQLALKIHRLGRTSFRKIKIKRDYHQHRKNASWLYLSRLSAVKEYAYMKVLYDRGFPVPQPVDFNRHCVVMELLDAFPLNHVKKIDDPGQLFSDLMNLLLKLGSYGLIHGDFNEFNIMISAQGRVTMIDFPQMVSTDHADAKSYFDRDVRCIREFFERKFGFIPAACPTFEDVHRTATLDREVEASGFNAELRREFDDAIGTALADASQDAEGEEGEGLEDDEEQGKRPDVAEDDEPVQVVEEEEDADVEKFAAEAAELLRLDDVGAAPPPSPPPPQQQHEATAAVDSADSAESSPSEPDLDPHRNRELLAFRDSAPREPEAAQKAAAAGSSSRSRTTSTATSAATGKKAVDPKIVRQKIAAEMQRKQNRQDRHVKVKRNHNKDPAVFKQRDAISNYDWEF